MIESLSFSDSRQMAAHTRFSECGQYHSMFMGNTHPIVLGMIKRQFKIIDKEEFGIIYKTYVRQYLEYCIQAWSPKLQKDKKLLEKVQRRAARMVKGLKEATI